MNNLKLDIFGPGRGLNHPEGSKMKKLFNPGKRSNSKASPTIEHPSELAASGHTLDRIVNAKEEARKKWLEQQEDFARKRQEHEMRMIAMEETEVARREQEVRQRNDDLDDKKRKNRMVQDAVAAQIRTLQEKLDEYKISHKSEEESLEDSITCLEDTLSDVKMSLEKRKRALEDEMLRPLHAHGHSPSAPSYDGSNSSENEDHMYPTLPVPAQRNSGDNFPNNKPIAPSRGQGHAHNQKGQVGVSGRRASGSIFNLSGSSPQTSHASSSRSVTPKTDSSDFDGSV